MTETQLVVLSLANAIVLLLAYLLGYRNGRRRQHRSLITAIDLLKAERRAAAVSGPKKARTLRARVLGR
jgi:hypothetical protein